MSDTPTFEWPDEMVVAVAKKLFVTNFFTPPPMPETWDAQHPIERATRMNKTRTALSALSPHIEELVEALRNVVMLPGNNRCVCNPHTPKRVCIHCRARAAIAKWGRFLGEL